MKKKQLEEEVLALARWGNALFIEQHGSYHQHALIIDMRGKRHMIVIGEVLHGNKMAGFLAAYALSVGGADAILIQADTRFEHYADEKVAKKREAEIADAAADGRYIIAENPKAQECFITCGRSREHTASVFQRYARTPSDEGDRITFTDEPNIVDGRAEISLIPNIWERVH